MTSWGVKLVLVVGSNSAFGLSLSTDFSPPIILLSKRSLAVAALAAQALAAQGAFACKGRGRAYGLQDLVLAALP